MKSIFITSLYFILKVFFTTIIHYYLTKILLKNRPFPRIIFFFIFIWATLEMKSLFTTDYKPLFGLVFLYGIVSIIIYSFYKKKYGNSDSVNA